MEKRTPTGLKGLNYLRQLRSNVRDPLRYHAPLNVRATRDRLANRVQKRSSRNLHCGFLIDCMEEELYAKDVLRVPQQTPGSISSRLRAPLTVQASLPLLITMVRYAARGADGEVHVQCC